MKRKIDCLLLTVLSVCACLVWNCTAHAALSNASLNGDYVFVGYYGSGSSSNQNPDATYVLNMSFDGAGNFTFDNGSGTYTVAADGVMNATSVDTETTVFNGVVGSGGNAVVLADTDTSVDGDVNLLIGVKKSASMSVASLNGDYAFVGYYGSGASSNENGDATYVLDMSFDGAGNFTFNNGSGVYTVSENGVLSATSVDNNDETTVFNGVVTGDGSAVVIVDTDAAVDGDVNLLVGLKKSAAMSNASLSGDYVVLGYLGATGESGAGEDATYILNMTFDGSGNFTFGNGTGTYTVAANGVFSATSVDSDDNETTIFNGVVSGDGSTFVIVDTDASVDGDVNILAGIAKTSTTVVSLAISGPENVLIGNCGMYRASVQSDQGRSSDVTGDAEWSIDCENVEMRSGGLLVTTSDNSPVSCSVSASYNDMEQTFEVSLINLVSCDVNGDGKVGLEEAIRALQIVSGAAP